MKTKLSVYVLTLTYRHELWVVTRRVSLWIRMQAVEMSFFCRVSGLYLRVWGAYSISKTPNWGGLDIWLGSLQGHLWVEMFLACPKKIFHTVKIEKCHTSTLCLLLFLCLTYISVSFCFCVCAVVSVGTGHGHQVVAASWQSMAPCIWSLCTSADSQEIQSLLRR